MFDHAAAATLELRGTAALVTMNRTERANVIDADADAALGAIAITLGVQVQAGPVQPAAHRDRGIPALLA